MIPERPKALDGEFFTDVSHREAASLSASPEPPILHPSQICPNCGERLTGFRCKMICLQCGYYMSCADYY
jgi:hypothetical protein